MKIFGEKGASAESANPQTTETVCQDHTVFSTFCQEVGVNHPITINRPATGFTDYKEKAAPVMFHRNRQALTKESLHRSVAGYFSLWAEDQRAPNQLITSTAVYAANKTAKMITPSVPEERFSACR